MTITINNKDYRLVWGMGAILIYCDKLECDLDGLAMIEDISKPLQQLKAILTIAYAAIQNGCEIDNRPLDVSYNQFQEWLDKADQNTANKMMVDFGQSQIFGRTLSEHFQVKPEPTGSAKKKSRSAK